MNDDGCSINDGNQYSDKNDMDKNYTGKLS